MTKGNKESQRFLKEETVFWFHGFPSKKKESL